VDPDAIWDGEWGRSRDGCIRSGSKGRGSVLGKCGASHCNEWGLCCVVVLCHERWRRHSYFLPVLFITLLCPELARCMFITGLVLFSAQVQLTDDRADVQQNEMSSSSFTELVSVILIELFEQVIANISSFLILKHSSCTLC